MNPITRKNTHLTLISALVAQLAAPAAMAQLPEVAHPALLHEERVQYLAKPVEESFVVNPPRESFLRGTDLPENHRAEAEYASRLRELQQQQRAETRRIERAGRLAAFRTFRQAVRLKGPRGLRAFRDQAVSWGPQAGGGVDAEARPVANNEWERWYDNVEARARVNALEAVVAARDAGHAAAMAKARRIAEEYRGKIARRDIKGWFQAFHEARRRGMKALDAQRIADEQVARAEALIEEKVAAKLAEAQAAELAKLEERALEAGYEAYAEEEEQAFATAVEVMDEHTMDPDEGVDEADRMSFEERQAWDQEQYEASQEQLRITRLQREGALLYGVPVSWGAE